MQFYAPVYTRLPLSDKPVILVVDDDGPILALMRNLLREFGFHAVTVTDGEMALDAAQRQRPSLVLLDRHMPGMSGDEVVRQLRALPGFDRLPILILSGEPLSREELATLGADGSVQKPFDIKVLIDNIRRHLETGRQL